MAVEFGPETLADVDAGLRALLPEWDFSPQASLSLLNVSENATYRVDEAGQSLVIRVHRTHYHQPHEIASELAWIQSLRQDGLVETPAPRHGKAGALVHEVACAQGPYRHAVAFDFVPGKEPQADADTVPWFKTLGRVTALMHQQSRQWSKPAGFARKTWDYDAMFGTQCYWGRWQEGVGLDEAGRALMGRALNLIERRLASFGRTADRFGLIHADLRLANLLVDDDRLRVIDFDDCGFSWHLYDFAAAISFFEHDPIVSDLQEAWVEGYRTVAPLAAEDVAELPVFIAMRRFLLVAWIASHPEVPIAQELGASYTAGALEIAEALLSKFS